MSRFSTSWALMKSSCEILKKDKELAVYPVLSSIASVIVFISFAYPIFSTVNSVNLNDPNSNQFQGISFVVLFLFYFCNYFVIIFFNSAIIACAPIRMEGKNPTVSEGLGGEVPSGFDKDLLQSAILAIR